MPDINWKRYLPVLVLVLIIVVGMLIYDDRPEPSASGPAEIAGEGEAVSGLPAIQGPEVDSTSPPQTTGAPPASLPEDDMFGTDMFWLLLQFILIFGGICGLAWLSLRWLLPRIYGANVSKSDQIKLLDTYRFDARRSLLLVEVRGKEYLLAGSEQGIQLIARVDDDNPGDAAEVPRPAGLETSTFEAVLRKGK
jgi:flagellar biogenesis protein FliO